MKKTVGIMTLYYRNYNYGGLLQAFALYKAIESMGFDCQQISYVQNAKGSIVKTKIKQILANPRELFEYLDRRKRAKEDTVLLKRLIEENESQTNQLFDDFIEFIPHSDVFTSKTINDIMPYDILVAGSDQIWNPMWVDKNYYLKFSSSSKKIAYAASAGKDHFSKSEIKALIKNIRDFSFVSVREKQFEEVLITNGFNKPVQTVLDPVFLLNREDWDLLCKVPDLQDKYVFSYLLGKSAEERERVAQVCKRLGLPLVVVPHVGMKYNSNDLEFGDIQMWNVGPRELIGLIKNAAYVLTDSFHGTAFSIILNKRFASFAKDKSNTMSLNSRIVNVLDVAGLNGRFVDIYSEEVFQVISNPIDFSFVNNNIENAKSISVEWLRSSLGEV